MAKAFVPKGISIPDHEQQPVVVEWPASVIQAAWMLKHTLAIIWLLSIIYLLLKIAEFFVVARGR